MNLVPCRLLDGEHIILALLQLLLPATVMSPGARRGLGRTVTRAGTTLLAANLALGVWRLVQPA